MNQNLVAELNELKQKRVKLEQEMNMKIDHYHEQLRKLDHEIGEMDESIRLERGAEIGSNRTENWNSEKEGTWSGEGKPDKNLYEREYINDTAHREEEK